MSRDLGDTTQRLRLSSRCFEMGFSVNMFNEILQPMVGKTNEEKELIAKQLLEDLESGKIKPDGPPRQR